MNIVIILLILINHFLLSFTDHSLLNQIVIPRQRSSIYQIDAFNQRLDLRLIPSEDFLMSSIDGRKSQECFYRGYVNEDLSSMISINACYGLFGMFIYDHVEYFIEPMNYRNDTQWNFEHLLSMKKNSMNIRGHCPVEGKPYFEEKQYYHYTRKKRHRDLDPSAKHVEILVAYDHSFRDFHSDIDVRSYILTLFNYVAHLYSDASIGNNIKIWVVKLVELGKELSDFLESSHDAGDILSKFCHWQRDNNKPGTYDAGILLTRIRLCNKRTNQLMESKCDTLGLTELGTMCNLTSSCAVVRDSGFATAFTIAHEIAHLFGIRHDNDQVCLNWNEEQQNLMATSLLFNHNHYQWSNCSRFYFTQYFESNRYPCVNNIPNDQSLLFENRELPGYSSDLNAQCRRAFGWNFEYCKNLSDAPKCSRLYCREMFSSSTSCVTNHAHWSDGSLCSEAGMRMKRCFRGECRPVEDLRPRDGNWGEWLPWSACTRTCGSAVRKSQRYCDNPRPENGGKYCSGSSSRLQSCDDNPPCENSLDTARQRQCSRYDNRSISLILPAGVRFEPKYNVLPNERCKLICKVSNDPLERSFIFNDRVEDGTPCSQDDENQDICIQGNCVPFGCDYKYGSNATEDMCGVCNGQNQTCQLINGRKFISQTGITNLVQIPLHTTRVRITQISSRKDRCYLAVKYLNGTYLLNGLHSLQLYPIKIRLHNSTVSYTGTESINETISIVGRLSLPIDIQIIAVDPLETISTEIYWEYYVPINETADDCSRPCQGVKTVKRCRVYGREYDLVYCLMFHISLAYDNERCNDHCRLNWTPIDQQTCSTRCGDGYKHVFYQCTKQGSNMEIIDDEICRKYVGEKPQSIVPCIGNCTGTGWVYGKWSECHHNGTCIRKRSVECRNSFNALVTDRNCPLEFIVDTEQCAQSACKKSRALTCPNGCSTPYWKTFAWEECTTTCLSTNNLRHRRVACFHKGLPVPDSYCDAKSKPIDQQWCAKNISCAKWFVSQWSSCSVTCNVGIQHRRVICKNQDVVISSNECDNQNKPRVIRRCRKRACVKTMAVWMIDSWTECNPRTCRQTRTVRCVDSITGHNRSISDCLKNRMQPFVQRVCPTSDCLEWRVARWHGCPVKCGIGVESGTGYDCYARQIPIRRLNTTSDCEAVKPPLDKPLLKRICRRNCLDWRTSDWNEMKLNNTSSKTSFSLLHFSIFIGIHMTHSL